MSFYSSRCFFSLHFRRSSNSQKKEIQKAIEKAGCHLVLQPPYSHDLNPIEHFW
ncbi:MAG: transposase, partial [Holosporaceae bacterium]|nr:transposase [Holosporaceae bacterium]